jgi:dGTP triphosphohydrolase
MVLKIKVIDENKLLRLEYERLKEEYNKLLNQKAEEIIRNQEFQEFVKDSIKDIIKDTIYDAIDDIVYEIEREIERKLSGELSIKEINMLIDQLPKKLLNEFKKLNFNEILKQIVIDAM